MDIHLKFFWGPTNLSPKNWVSTNFESKNVDSNKIWPPNKFWGQGNFGSKEIFGPKTFWVPKILGPQNLVSKNIWSKKIMGPKKNWVHLFGPK